MINLHKSVKVKVMKKKKKVKKNKAQKRIQKLLEATEKYENHFNEKFPLSCGTFAELYIEDCIKANKPMRELYPELIRHAKKN